MKTILPFCFVLICVNTYSQSILSDKTVASTNTRTIATGTNPLHKSFAKTIQVQSQVNMQDNAITSYDLNFTAPDLEETNNTGTLPNTCLLQDKNGNTFTGIIANESSISSSANQPSYTCRFSKDDFYKIVALKITSIKIITANGKSGSFLIDRRLQDIISKQAQTILKRLNEPQ